MAKDETCKIETVANSHTNNELAANANAFNACGKEERREAIRTLKEIGQASSAPTSGTEEAKMLHGVEFVYDSVSAKINSVHSEKPLPDGTSDRGSGARSAATNHDGKAGKPAHPEAAQKPQPADTGRPGVDDMYARSAREALKPEDKEKANQIVKKILNGEDVSSMLNGLDRDQKRGVLAEAVGQLAEKPGSKVKVSEDGGIDGNRYISIEMGDKTKLLVTESKMGLPRDILVNGSRWNHPGTWFGANDVYDRPGEPEQKKAAQAAEDAAKPNWRDRLVGPNLMDGNGPMARLARGEEISAAEMDDLKKKGFVYDPKVRGGDD